MALRIASLISSATEILYALDLGEQVVAISHDCDFPPEVVGKPRATLSHVDSSASSAAIDHQVKTLTATGSALYGVDSQLLARLKPDLIVTQSQCDVCAVRHQDVLDIVASEPALANSQVIALNPQSLADVFADTQTLAAATGREAEAETLLAHWQQRIAAIVQKPATSPAAQRPRVVCIEWLEPLMLAANWTPQLIDLAGGVCPLTVGGEHSRYHNWQEIVDFDPEVIIVSPCGFDLPRTLKESAVLPAWQGWSHLSAVKNNRVWAVDGNAYLNCPGPRLVDSVEILHRLFFPHDATPAIHGVANIASHGAD